MGKIQKLYYTINSKFKTESEQHLNCILQLVSYVGAMIYNLCLMVHGLVCVVLHNVVA